MKINNNVVRFCGGQRKQSKPSFTRPNWAYIKDHQRSFTIRRINNQFVINEKGLPLTCIVHKRKDPFEQYHYVAHITESIFDKEQSCNVIQKTGVKLRVTESKDMPDFWNIIPDKDQTRTLRNEKGDAIEW